MNMSFLSGKHKSVFLLFLHLSCLCWSTINSSTKPTPSSNLTLQDVFPGCKPGLDLSYTYLCDRQAVWGIVLESLASSGFLVSVGVLVGLLVWSLWACTSSRHHYSSIGSTVACISMFMLATAGIFAVTFAFIIRLTPQTCPTRLFLFGVLFSLAFSCLLAHSLALQGFAAARSWGEPALVLGLFAVQVIIAVEWLILVLVRDKKPCQYSQEEFAMLLIYVLCLLAISSILSLRFLYQSCITYHFSYPRASQMLGCTQATMLCLTLLLSVCIWVVWICLLTWGNPKMDRRPQWDDPVLSVALVANGWVLLLGHGLPQVAYLCRGEAKSKGIPLSFTGWTSPNAEIPGLGTLKEGKENGSFENDGRRPASSVRSPYDSGLSLKEIDSNKDYSIPRPTTTNFLQPYDEYYGSE
ncbi:G-protein coupled receptor family C group 5 member D [Thalassophryne amazonica]|uniref:G-protein coupled receptor family C group 5 member D n=1 Tax=Thalassophryne amazonica TaxID=390379 RepID=UPI001471CF10|nr:G-protein coupled receptor family C group 5 member D [Thalassophryne amazonica]